MRQSEAALPVRRADDEQPRKLVVQLINQIQRGSVRTVCARLLRALIAPDHELQEWVYVDQNRADGPSRGHWAGGQLLVEEVRNWPRIVSLVSSTCPLGIAHESREPGCDDFAAHNTILTFAYVLALAAQQRASVRVLDFGGGLGHYSLYMTALLKNVHVDYTVVDLAEVAEAGQRLNPGVRFLSSLNRLRDEHFDVVVASSSLQYQADWRMPLDSLVSAARRYLFITRVPIVRRTPSYLTLQRVRSWRAVAEHRGWVISRDELVSEMSRRRMLLVREFLVQERHVVRGAPEQPTFRGFLFEREEWR